MRKTLASIVICIRMIRRLRRFMSSTSFLKFTAAAMLSTISPLRASIAICTKGTNLTGIDPETSEITELFHPRRQRWEDHFEWQGIYLIGKTATGRTTIRVLNINSEDQVALRSS